MNETLGDALAELLARLLGGLQALDTASRHLDPQRVATIGTHLAAGAGELARALERIEPLEWPTERRDDGLTMLQAARATQRAMLTFAERSGDPRALFELYRALRSRHRAHELLFPLRTELRPLSDFFSASKDDAEQQQLFSAAAEERGIGHVENESQQRGGFSIFNPFPRDHRGPHPLVVALHGGSGHGRDALWWWVAAARTKGAVVVAPTSLDRTWSLMSPATDGANLLTIVEATRRRLPIDAERILLTGMSDGGTFSYLLGLQEASPFTHLAPISGVLPPLTPQQQKNARGRRIRLVHGALDWMFPVDTARTAAAELTALGADLEYCEVDDLSHTYPTEQNPELLDWLCGRTESGAATRDPESD
ncbi:MAG: phospholipase [Acidobacteriota bacterium]